MSGGDKQVENDVDLDEQHFMKTVASFRFFGVHMMKKLERTRNLVQSLSPHQQSLISEIESYNQKTEKCVLHNNELLKKIIEHSAPDIFNGEHSAAMMQDAEDPGFGEGNAKQAIAVSNRLAKLGPFAFTTTDMDKVRSTLKQFVRDWSSVGETERNICYKPVIDDIMEIFDKDGINRADVHILIPGAGLGRLAWELAHRGFTSQGNEWSLHMLIPAYFILNTCKTVNEHTLYPWVSQTCNNMSRADQFAPVKFPDVCPSDLPTDVQFSMAAGDFVEIYTEPDAWDCVATVFFIDTAHNILVYLETIWKILKPGGYWINFGPLLYHFSEIPGEDSLDLSYEEIQLAIRRIGFEVVKERTGIRCGYTQNPASMLSYEYSCVYGQFRKPLSCSPHTE